MNRMNPAIFRLFCALENFFPESVRVMEFYKATPQSTINNNTQGLCFPENDKKKGI